jgi:HD-GYP domain-containing protein (c-di-GMP phosphodiesterase class II)
VQETRVAELLAALSLTTDLAGGVPFEKGLQVCVLADEFARGLGVDEETRATVFHAALLRSVGCTSHAPENADLFIDDTAFQRVLKQLDPADPDVFAAQMKHFGDWAEDSSQLAQRFFEVAPTEGPAAASNACEVSRALAPLVGCTARVVAVLDDIYERWDGLGIPFGKSGGALAWEARVLHVAEQAVTARTWGGDGGALAEVERRAGGHLDPHLARSFIEQSPKLLPVLGAADVLGEALSREPWPRRKVRGAELGELCRVLGTVADLKSTYLIGHSQHVARVVSAAASASSLSDESHARLVAAAMLHNLGCAIVPSSMLDAVATSSAAVHERMRLHGYWTRRILERCPSLTDLEPLTRPAAALHVAFAEGGYVRWTRPSDLPAHAFLPLEARLLEAAEAYASLTEPRPGRPSLAADQAAAHLCAAAEKDRLDANAVDSVLAGAGQEAPRRTPPGGLTAREVEVLRHAARGCINREIAARLYISERTVGHHLAHVYDKTGLRTRAGVAVWAVENGLLP